MQQPSFIDRYRWWLFLGSFGIQIVASLAGSISIWVALGISLLAEAYRSCQDSRASYPTLQRRRKERDATNEQS